MIEPKHNPKQGPLLHTKDQSGFPSTPSSFYTPDGLLLNSLFSIHDRMGRLSMMAAWLGLIACFVVFNFAAHFLFMITGSMPHGDPRMAGVGMILGDKGTTGISIIALVVYFNISVVRRLHDLNRSGWWIVAPIVLSIIVGVIIFASISSVRMVFGGIFIINLCWFFYLTLAPGSKSANRFGPPRYTSSAEKSLGWISMVLFLLIAVFVGTMILILGQVRKTSMATSAMSTASAPVAGV